MSDILKKESGITADGNEAQYRVYAEGDKFEVWANDFRLASGTFDYCVEKGVSWLKTMLSLPKYTGLAYKGTSGGGHCDGDRFRDTFGQNPTSFR